MNKKVVWTVVIVLLCGGLIALATWRIQSGLSSLGAEMAEGMKDLDESEDGGSGDKTAAQLKEMPDNFQKQIAHVDNMIRLMKENLSDCQQLGDKLEAYTQEHQEDLDKLELAERSAKRAMNAQERADYEEKSLSIMKPRLFKMVKFGAVAAIRCPEQAKALEKVQAEME